MKYINDLSTLDRELDYVDSQFKISDDYGRVALSGFCYKIDNSKIPADPYSREYHDFQMDLYRGISGRSSYSIKNEESVFNFDDVKNEPFPYYTHSASTVGDQLLAIGYIIKKTNLLAGSNIVEFGSGWGNSTMAFSQMGHNVTCVEVEKRFIDLIRYRTKELSRPIEFYNGDMLDFILDTDKKFDAAIFFESFHHSSEPMKLLKGLSKILKDGGIVCFASEPLVDMNSDIVPYPWGVRLDGMSLWSIRRFGWMELGFEISFFLKTLSMYGFDAQKYSSDVSPLTNIIIAKKNKKRGVMSSVLNTLKNKINSPVRTGD